MARVSSGAYGELLAARFLRKKGYTVITANYRSRFGEIDLIVEDGGHLIFVEVKTRSEGAMYEPREAVTRSKQEKIVRTAALYIKGHPTEKQPRFDVVEIILSKNDPKKVVQLDHLIATYETEGLHAAF